MLEIIDNIVLKKMFKKLSGRKSGKLRGIKKYSKNGKNATKTCQKPLKTCCFSYIFTPYLLVLVSGKMVIVIKK